MADTNPGAGPAPRFDPTTNAAAPAPADGTALCLSGGGYRAMLFHVGTICRLNHAGWLRKLTRVSSRRYVEPGLPKGQFIYPRGV